VTSLLGGCATPAPEGVLERSERFDAVLAAPPPSSEFEMSLGRTLSGRRSGRAFADEDLTTEVIATLFWSAQGVTDAAGHRTAPSAGALYPLELYAVTDEAMLHYLPDEHQVEIGGVIATPADLAAIAFGQEWIGDAPVVIVIAGVVARTEAEYGAVAERLMDREAGPAAQNLLLATVALGMASVPVGGFDPQEAARLLALPPGQEVLYLIPVGHRT